MKMMLTNVKGDVHLNVYLRVKTPPAATLVELTFVHQSMRLIHLYMILYLYKLTNVSFKISIFSDNFLFYFFLQIFV